MEKVTCFGTDKVKDTWDYCNNFSFDEKDLYGISWPPRQYTCSFCRRKFKSAQALGGHMNVHRRDRAMLRQPPSWVVQYPSPNPSPSPNLEFKYSSSTSSSSSSLSPSSATLPSSPYSTNYKLKNSLMMMSPSLTSLSSASSASSIYDERKVMVMGPPPRKKPSSPRRREKTKQSMRSLCSTVELEGFNQEDEYKAVMNNGQIDALRLDLEIGLVRNKKEDLDLELRLGYC